MNAQKEITLSGVGGQGTILCGTMIAEAAVLHDGKKATLSSEYGTETRGTFAKSDVIISDQDIYFPDCTNQDIIVCLHQIAYERYSGKLPEKAIMLYDADQITPHEGREEKEKGIPIGTMAMELGNPQTANILTMGIITGYVGMITEEGAKDSVKRFFGKKGEKVVELNLRAFEKGLEVGKKL